MTEGVLSTFSLLSVYPAPLFLSTKAAGEKEKKRWKTSIALLAPLA
jgi:hypothetical protein